MTGYGNHVLPSPIAYPRWLPGRHEMPKGLQRTAESQTRHLQATSRNGCACTCRSEHFSIRARLCPFTAGKLSFITTQPHCRTVLCSCLNRTTSTIIRTSTAHGTSGPIRLIRLSRPSTLMFVISYASEQMHGQWQSQPQVPSQLPQTCVHTHMCCVQEYHVSSGYPECGYNCVTYRLFGWGKSESVATREDQQQAEDSSEEGSLEAAEGDDLFGEVVLVEETGEDGQVKKIVFESGGVVDVYELERLCEKVSRALPGTWNHMFLTQHPSMLSPSLLALCPAGELPPTAAGTKQGPGIFFL